MEYNKFKKVSIKIYKCFYLDDIIKFQDFGSDSNLLDEMSYENILILQALDSIKQKGSLGFMIRQDILYYLALKNIMPFTGGLDIL